MRKYLLQCFVKHNILAKETALHVDEIAAADEMFFNECRLWYSAGEELQRETICLQIFFRIISAIYNAFV